MKRFLAIALAASMGLVFAGTASAATVGTYAAGAAAGGVATSMHNLGAFGTHATTSGTTEICVFCHTPHHTERAGAVQDYRPLWNRSINLATFTAYGTTTAGTVVTAPGGTSLACLSCHDGVTTLDNIINAPGPGGVNTGAARVQGWVFNDGGISSTAPVTSGTGFLGTSITIGGLDNGRLNIGSDLSNDHPISVTYNGGTAASLRATSTVISSLASATDAAGSLSAGLAITTGGDLQKNLRQNRWAVKGFISDTATIADLLRGGKVECSSCHDPHFNNAASVSTDQGFASNANSGPGTNGGDFFASDSAATSGLFLRRVGGNVGSGVCRTCHAK